MKTEQKIRRVSSFVLFQIVPNFKFKNILTILLHQLFRGSRLLIIYNILMLILFLWGSNLQYLQYLQYFDANFLGSNLLQTVFLHLGMNVRNTHCV